MGGPCSRGRGMDIPRWRGTAQQSLGADCPGRQLGGCGCLHPGCRNSGPYHRRSVLSVPFLLVNVTRSLHHRSKLQSQVHLVSLLLLTRYATEWDCGELVFLPASWGPLIIHLVILACT